MTFARKQNVAGFMDEQGRFRPIRSPKFVGRPSRRATSNDKKKYSRAKAGDLGKKKQERALEDVFDREIRKQREEAEKDKRYRDRLMKKIERESLGDADEIGPGQTLVQFVRSEGGIRRTYKFGGKAYRGKKVSYDAGELEPLTYKQSGKRGLVTDKGGKTLDGMYQRAREAGYDVADPWDLVDKLGDEIRGGKVTYKTHGYLSYNPRRKKVSASRLAKAAISTFDVDFDLDVDSADLKKLQAVSRKLASRRKNTAIKRNPVGWFKDVSPVTPEAVKKLYKKLASKWHPDKPSGDLRTMQQINADYDKALKIAISGEGNEARADAERKAAKPLREAIKFAVTLPDDVEVVIRGLWLWLQGNTFSAREKIKSFVASDGNRFKWASQKKAWFFAAVPSKNRRGEMSFAEIDQLYGKDVVKERKQRRELNPIHPINAFAAGASGILSALQIKQHLAKSAVKSMKKRAATKRSNPVGDAYLLTIKYKSGKVRSVHVVDAKSNKPISRFRSAAGARKFANANGLRLVENPKLTSPKRKDIRRKRNAVPRRRTFEMFQGRKATIAKPLAVSRHAPAKLDQLVDLIELRLNSGKVLKFNGKRFKLCAANGRLWIAGGKFAKADLKQPTRVLNPVDQIHHVVYGTYKPHHGDHKYTHYIHRLGEETGHLPTLAVDRDGFPVIRGGQYKIEARGIVN